MATKTRARELHPLPAHLDEAPKEPMSTKMKVGMLFGVPAYLGFIGFILYKIFW